MVFRIKSFLMKNNSYYGEKSETKKEIEICILATNFLNVKIFIFPLYLN